MKEAMKIMLPVAVAVLTLSASMSAHHSQSIFDLQNLTTLTGTVTAFEFSNPHVVIYLEVKNDKAGVEKWTISSTAPNNLQRMGWNRNTLKPGDRITISGNRHKQRQPLMYLREIVLPSGKAVTVN